MHSLSNGKMLFTHWAVEQGTLCIICVIYFLPFPNLSLVLLSASPFWRPFLSRSIISSHFALSLQPLFALWNPSRVYFIFDISLSASWLTPSSLPAVLSSFRRWEISHPRHLVFIYVFPFPSLVSSSLTLSFFPSLPPSYTSFLHSFLSTVYP